MTWSYKAYSNVDPAAFRRLPRGGFVHARLVPICPFPGAWLVSGSMSAYRKSGAAQIAQAALAAATQRPELVYRNPEKLKWVAPLIRRGFVSEAREVDGAGGVEGFLGCA